MQYKFAFFRFPLVKYKQSTYSIQTVVHVMCANVSVKTSHSDLWGKQHVCTQMHSGYCSPTSWSWE